MALRSGTRAFAAAVAAASEAAEACCSRSAGPLSQTIRLFSTFPSWMGPDQPGTRRIATPLTQALPNLPASAPYTRSLEPPPTEVTTLSNGVRIVSEATPGPTASLGLYVNSGSIYETPSTSGCSALLELLAFKSTRHRSTQALGREVEKIGANIMANASREQMSYTIDCLKTGVPAALELVCDAVLNPALVEGEVGDARARLAGLMGSRDAQMTLLNEQLVRGAYGGALGQPLIPDPDQLQALGPSQLAGFVAQNYSGPRVVLAGSGVEHQALVALAAPMLEQLPPTPAPPEPPSHYRGGFVHLPGPNPQAHLLLAFEYRGGWRNVQGAVCMTVLTYLLGGGNSFSSGGPGKGMHSRLYTAVLSTYPWVHACTAFNSTFNDTGLVGIQAACEPGHVHEMLSVMCSQLESVARNVKTVELERAKRAAISIIHNALESKATSAEDIGRQFLTYGHRISGRQYVDMISDVTPRDICAFVSSLLACPRPSLAVHGDGSDAVQYETLLERFGRGSAGAAAEGSGAGGAQGSGAGAPQQPQSLGSRLLRLW